MDLGDGCHRDHVPFSLFQGQMISTWLITGDINLGYFAIVVSPRFLCYKVTIFPLSILFIRNESKSSVLKEKRD